MEKATSLLLTNPTLKRTRISIFYDPNITQNINRKNSRVTGAKSFKYYGIPNEPGTYRLKDYFQLAVFQSQDPGL